MDLDVKHRDVNSTKVRRYPHLLDWTCSEYTSGISDRIVSGWKLQKCNIRQTVHIGPQLSQSEASGSDGDTESQIHRCLLT